MSKADNLIADFTSEVENTRKLLAAVPEAKLDWKPHEKSFSLAELAGHIAETPTWLSAVMGDDMDFAAMGDYKPLVPTSHAELMKAFEEAVATFAPQLEDKDDAFLAEDWAMLNGDQVLTRAPRAQVIRDVLIHHLIHHRGQLTVYLRLLGEKVPSTYGGTADEPMF